MTNSAHDRPGENMNGHEERSERVVPRIRVGVLDTDDLLREGLTALLNTAPDMVCIGAWRNTQEAMAVLPQTLPDVLLLDVRMAGQAAFELLRSVPTVTPRTRVIAMVACMEDHCIVFNAPLAAAPDPALRVISAPFAPPDDCLQIALKTGAHGVLRKQCSFRDVARAIRAVHSGQYWMESETATRLAQQYLLSLNSLHTPTATGTGALTLRERQVVTLIAHGRSNKEIAHELQLSYSTVKNYVSSILTKLELSDRTQIALFALNQVGVEA